MPIILPYNREAAVSYANRWALSRNPQFFDYSDLGGDCTNFASQCLFAGSGVMNYTPTFGWYYINGNDKSPSWTGVKYLYDFLTTNNTRAVFGEQADLRFAEIGDIIQLQNYDGRFYHTLVITRIRGGRIYVNSHSANARQRLLDTYTFANLRCIHILGYYL